MNHEHAADLQNDKYVVMKKEDFVRILTDLRTEFGKGVADPFMDAPIEDAVVIRRQDRFAASAFDTYSNQILGYLEIIEDMGLRDPELQALADFFADQGHMARASKRKLPD